MPAVNRDSLTLTHSPQVETPHAEVPVARATSTTNRAATSQVESFNPSNTSLAVQQGSTVGSIAASAVGQLDANAVVGQVKELMGGWRVSADDCQHAVGLLKSLPAAEYGKAVKELSRSGELRVLCESIPAELRRDLAESVVHGGLTTMSPGLLARGLRDPQPPAQPAMISNAPSLPKELREVIHGENLTRARKYEADFNAYADAWCAKVATCQSPMALRELGQLSNPPRLLEPGISDSDLAAKRFVSLHCQINIGAERAAKAVSEQVSVFRKELAAGSFGLTFEVRGQATFDGEVAKNTRLGAGGGFEARGTLTQDGRLIDQGAKTEAVVAGGRGHNKVEAKFDAEGHLEAAAAEVGGFGLELERAGDVTFKAPVAPGIAVESFVNHRNATSGAALGGEEEGEFLGAHVKVEARIGFTAKGIDRSYYADIGGAQEGFFGPMPELTNGSKWSELPKDRREWYGRQGFDENFWPK
jgi:hypothetical protein